MRINEPQRRALPAGPEWGAATARLRRRAAAHAVVPSRSRQRSLSRMVQRHLARLIRMVATWPERQRTLAALSAMSDRELADIGLSRSEIGHVFGPEFVRDRVRRAATGS